ncbi:MAG: lipopolysaccharide biosynthesis protein [Bdellovibrionia bacterium]
MYAIRSARHFLTGVFVTGAGAVLSLLVTPYLIHALGGEAFGAYRTLVEWAGYFTLLEFGINEGVITLFSRAAAKRDGAGAGPVFRIALAAHAKILPVKLLAVAIFVWFVPRFIHVSADSVGDLSRAALFMSLTLAFLNPIQIFRMYWEAEQKGYLVNLWLLAQNFTTAAIGILCAGATLGISGQGAAFVSGYVVLYGAIFFGVCHDRGWPPWKGEASGVSAKELSDLRKPFAVSNVLGRVSVLSDSIVIALFMGPVDVTVFYVTQRLPAVTQNLLYGLGNATWAPLSDLHAKGMHEVFRERFIELTRLLVILSMLSLGPLFAYNRSFVGLWTGAATFGGDLLSGLTALSALFLALISFWAWIFSATGRAAILLPQHFAFAGLNVAASLFFTANYGLAGPVLGTMTATLLVSMITVPSYLKREFGFARRDLYFAVGKPFLIMIVPVLIRWRYPAPWAAQSWALLIAAVAFEFLLLTLVTWFLVLTDREREHWARRFKDRGKNN